MQPDQTTTMQRPDPPPDWRTDRLPGRWEVRLSPSWHTPVTHARRCSGQLCTRAPVAEINRDAHQYATGRTLDRWYGACPAHLRGYGNWVEDGRVVSWRYVLAGTGEVL